MDDLHGAIPVVTLRPSSATLILTMIGCVGLAVFAVVGSAVSSELHGVEKVLSASLVSSLALAPCYFLVLRPKLIVRDEAIEITGPLTRRLVSLTDIENFDGGLRLKVLMKSGEVIQVWAVQNSRLTELRGAWGPSDVAAKALRQRFGFGVPGGT